MSLADILGPKTLPVVTGARVVRPLDAGEPPQRASRVNGESLAAEIIRAIRAAGRPLSVPELQERIPVKAARLHAVCHGMVHGDAHLLAKLGEWGRYRYCPPDMLPRGATAAQSTDAVTAAAPHVRTERSSPPGAGASGAGASGKAAPDAQQSTAARVEGAKGAGANAPAPRSTPGSLPARTMSDQIRSVMSATVECSSREIVAASRVAAGTVRRFLIEREACGEVIKTGERRNYRYRLNPDFVPWAGSGARKDTPESPPKADLTATARHFARENCLRLGRDIVRRLRDSSATDADPVLKVLVEQHVESYRILEVLPE